MMFNVTPTEDRTTTARLAELNVFPDASERDLRSIAKSGTVVSVPRGWSLIWEKTPADKAYVVLRGSASAQHNHEEFARIEEGELIGEMAIVNRQLRSATVVAATPMEVLHFTKETVERLREELPAFRDAVEASAVSRM
jgi:CRP/FNR family cyclic AMP-dependent transcriptional regulator